MRKIKKADKPNNKVFKEQIPIIFRMFPSDLTGSLDAFYIFYGRGP